MESLIVIKNKHEIIAIFRDHIKNKGKSVIKAGHIKKDIEFESINYEHIIVHDKDNSTIEGGLSCEMYSSLGLIIFDLIRDKEMDGKQSSRMICKIPKKITIIQRRRHPRIFFNEDLNYTGTGRLKNGKLYNFKIKDISDGGCALITERKEIELDTILRHVKLDFCEFGFFISTLKVKKITEDENIIRLSCQFIFKDEEEKSRIEILGIRLNLTQRKRRS